MQTRLHRILRCLLDPLRNQRGAVTITTVLVGVDSHIDDVEATADGDTTATIPHGLGATPLDVAVTALLRAPAGFSEWATTTIDGTNVVLTKSTAVGSGSAGVQVRVITKRPHSIGR